MTTFVDIASDDRLWVRVIPAADLINLFWVPHQFIRDVVGKTLTDSFVIQFIEREVSAEVFAGSKELMIDQDTYILSGIDNTGVVIVEGVAPDIHLSDARLPFSTGHDSAFTKVENTFYGGLHADVRGDMRGAAATMVMAIRHRSTLEGLIGRMSWRQRILDGSGHEIRSRENVRYDTRFAAAPIIYAHGTERTYPDSCHAIPGYINTDLDLGGEREIDTIPLTLTGIFLKAN